MSGDFLEQIGGLVPREIQVMQGKKWQEVLAGWETYFKEYGIAPEKQREEFDSIMRIRMSSLIMSVAPPTDYEKGTTLTLDTPK